MGQNTRLTMGPGWLENVIFVVKLFNIHDYFNSTCEHALVVFDVGEWCCGERFATHVRMGEPRANG